MAAINADIAAGQQMRQRHAAGEFVIDGTAQASARASAAFNGYQYVYTASTHLVARDVGGHAWQVDARPDYAARMEVFMGPPLSHGISHDELRRRADDYANRCARQFPNFPGRAITLRDLPDVNTGAYLDRYVDYMRYAFYRPFTNERRQQATKEALVDMLQLRQLTELTPDARRFFFHVATQMSLMRELVSYAGIDEDTLVRFVFASLAPRVQLELHDALVATTVPLSETERNHLRRTLGLLRENAPFTQRAMNQAHFAPRVFAPDTGRPRGNAGLPDDVARLIESFAHGLEPTTSREQVIRVAQEAATVFHALAAQAQPPAVAHALGAISQRMGRMAEDLVQGDAKRARKGD